MISREESTYRETVFLISCEIRNHCIAKRIGSNPRIVLYPHARCSVSIDKRKSVAQILRERHAMRMDNHAAGNAVIVLACEFPCL